MGAGPRSRLRLGYERVAFYGLLVLFGLTCLAWSLPAGLLHRLLPRRAGARLGQRAISTGFRCYLAAMRGDLGALDALRAEGPLVICPNHPSLLDAVLVVSRLPRVVCIMKSSVWDNPFLGGGARLAGYVRNDGSPIRLVKAAAEALRAGQQLLIFPEGTRTEVPPVGGFKGGFALVARAAGAPVQTVFLESNTRFLGKGWGLFRKPSFPLVYKARLGRRFDVPDDLQAFVAELEGHFRDELARGGIPRPPDGP